MNEPSILHDNTYSLDQKVEFLNHPEAYPFATSVQALETHMSWVFLTDRHVYKLKKPVVHDFLDFQTLEARYNYCMEEVLVNQPLAGDTYEGIVALTMHQGSLQLNGEGEPIDWLVKMKRLPEQHMLHNAIKKGNVPNQWIQQAAEMLTDFYVKLSPVRMAPQVFRQNMITSIEQTSAELLRNEFKLQHSLVISIAADLLHFIIKYDNLFDQSI
jgi:aminoglycoside phosphotransferase family enzyme